MASFPNDAELMADYLRVRRVGPGAVFEACRVRWNGQTPYRLWKCFQTWQQIPTEAEIAEAKLAALDSLDYFRVCLTCRDRYNAGQMHDGTLCQGCAQSELGILY